MPAHPRKHTRPPRFPVCNPLTQHTQPTSLLFPFSLTSPCCPPPTWPFGPPIFFIVEPCLIDTRPVSVLHTDGGGGWDPPVPHTPTPQKRLYRYAQTHTHNYSLHSIDYHSDPRGLRPVKLPWMGTKAPVCSIK